MLQAFINVFKIAELRSKLFFTFAMLAVYRIGFWIPVPGVSQEALTTFFEQQSQTGGAFGRLASYMAIFSGGSLSQSTIFGLGIMPYISAAIIFQLLNSVVPALKKLKEEGPSGQQKIQEWTRYATIGLCIVQSIAWLQFITRASTGAGGLVQPWWSSNPLWWLMAICSLTAGTVFLMWLGEQIDKHGIGNGVSLIITAGILSQMPWAIMEVVRRFDPGASDGIGLMGVVLLAGGFVLVVAGSVLMTVAQRRILIQQAKHTRGRKVYGGQRSYLPLRVNHGGVMPIIFASSLMIFPSVMFSAMGTQLQVAAPNSWWTEAVRWIGDELGFGSYLYVILYIGMVYFFSYFWITVQFNPEEMSKQLRDHGSFIPGLRPGPRTAEYLESVMERITYVGAAFLAFIAVLPMVVGKSLNVPFTVTQFLGGTGLLIVVSVCLDFIQRVEANLLMRNYAGFLGGGDDGRGPKMRGPRY
ncbi:MAG: preprotein translocase subunit SecY [Planctomycetes bacterium]|nr:preprotein translocase subunit SecY [Planctomycetota bacterium]MCH9057222.1 preprotein translocase subunit SecY [Planctomycetota bacterium]